MVDKTNETKWFPVVPGTKKPAIAWSNPANLRSDEPPEEVYGVPTGPVNSFWVLDIDRKNGVDGEAALMAYAEGREEIANTWTMATPSGGRHLYFTWDNDRPVGNRVGVLPGVDVRGAGGYVCAGGEYELTDETDIAPAPEWLYELIGTKVAAEAIPVTAITPDNPEWSHRITSAEMYLKREPVCVEGEGGQKQIWLVALKLSRTYALPVDTSLALIADYNARCRPPWTEDELRRHLTRAATDGYTEGLAAPQNFLDVVQSAQIVGPAVAQNDDAVVHAAPVLPTVVDDSIPWRRFRNPDHVYTFNLALAVAGGADDAKPTSQKNIAAALTGPAATSAWCGVWQYDQFRRRKMAVNPPIPLDAETIGVTNDDIVKVQMWYACHGVKASIDQVRAAIDLACSCAQFHPIRDYLDALPTMSVQDGDRYFQGIAGRLWEAPVERDAHESANLRRLAIAAVRRIRRPGTKVDEMLILAGPQGHRKSMFCAHLFGVHFRDQMPDIAMNGGREASIALEGYWGVEMAEMVAFSHAKEAIKKEFITRSEDKYRPLWAASTLVVPRQVVFIGTTNEDDFLRDPTGAGRYPVCDISSPIDLSFSRDEFWAAAVAIEASGEQHWVDRRQTHETEERVATSAARYELEDPWTSVVLQYARSRAESKGGPGWVTAAEALTFGVPVPADRQKADDLVRVKAILRKHLGTAAPRWVDQRTQRCYPVLDAGAPPATPLFAE